MLFATIGEFFGQAILVMGVFIFFVLEMVKRADKDGKVKIAARRTAVRGGWAIFNHLTKKQGQRI